jgi:hypothetical protein
VPAALSKSFRHSPRWPNAIDADHRASSGLGRSSIYNTFSSKRDMFDRAIRRYMEAKTARQLEPAVNSRVFTVAGSAPLRWLQLV